VNHKGMLKVAPLTHDSELKVGKALATYFQKFSLMTLGTQRVRGIV